MLCPTFAAEGFHHGYAHCRSLHAGQSELARLYEARGAACCQTSSGPFAFLVGYPTALLSSSMIQLYIAWVRDMTPKC